MEPTPEDPENWANTSRCIRTIAERLLIAGWITRAITDEGAVTIYYTPTGEQKMRQLLSLCDELGFATFEKDHMFGLWLTAQLGPPPPAGDE